MGRTKKKRSLGSGPATRSHRFSAAGKRTPDSPFRRQVNRVGPARGRKQQLPRRDRLRRCRRSEPAARRGHGEILRGLHSAIPGGSPWSLGFRCWWTPWVAEQNLPVSHRIPSQRAIGSPQRRRPPGPELHHPSLNRLFGAPAGPRWTPSVPTGLLQSPPNLIPWASGSSVLQFTVLV